jgi:ABC-type multidrug transport system ATPase subunit
MDPESRRKIWNLLLECRKTKTILISTHFMEEADILGDRVAIMANGSLQCYDTPMRLKIKYGNTQFVFFLTHKIYEFILRYWLSPVVNACFEKVS